MILCSKLKIVTKSQVVTKFNVTKSRLHCTAHTFVRNSRSKKQTNKTKIDVDKGW